MDRRTFLGAMAATPLIFGLREILAQESPASPKWYADALQRMKDRNLHGIVLVVPADDPDQKKVGESLWSLVEGRYTEAHEIFTGSVFTCMSPSVALAIGLRKDGTKNRFLLNPQGTVLESDEVTLEAVTDPAKFPASFHSFLYGEKRDRLKLWAEAERAKAPAEIVAALKSLESEDLETREAASSKLKDKAGEYHSLLVWTRVEASTDEVRSRVKSVLEEHFKKAEKGQVGMRLPYGTRVPKYYAGCGGRIEMPEQEEGQGESIKCGMGRVNDAEVKEFLRFLVK